MSDMSAVGTLTFDSSNAVSGVQNFMQSLNQLGQTTVTQFYALQAFGQGIQDLGSRLASGVGSMINTSMNLQTSQAQLETQMYNTGASFSANNQAAAQVAKGLEGMAVSTKQPINQIMQLGATVAGFGYRGNAIVGVTKAFSEFGAVTGANMQQLAPQLQQVMNQFHIGAGGVNSFTSALYNVARNTAGGTRQMGTMLDRMSSLNFITGLSAKQTLGLVGTIQQVTSLVRGGINPVSNFGIALDKAFQTPQALSSQALFGLMGLGNNPSASRINALQRQWTSNPYGTIEQFARNYGNLPETTRPTMVSNAGLGAITDYASYDALAQMVRNGKMQQMLQVSSQGWQSGTSVHEGFRAIQSTAGSAMTQFRDQVTLLANAFGSTLLPALTRMASVAGAVVSAFDMIPAPIRELIAGSAAAASGILLLTAGITKLKSYFDLLMGGWRKVAGGGTGGVTAATTNDALVAALEQNTIALQENTAALAMRGPTSMEPVSPLGGEAAAGESAVAAGEGAAIAESGAAAGQASRDMTTLASETAAAGEASAGATAMFAGLGGTLARLGSFIAPLAGITALSFAFSAVHNQTAQANAAAQQFVGKWNSSHLQTSSLSKIHNEIGQTQSKLSQLYQQTRGRNVGLTEFGAAGAGAAGGAAIGSLIAPGVGTITGGLIGGAIGLFGGGKLTQGTKQARAESQGLTNTLRTLRTEEDNITRAMAQFGLTAQQVMSRASADGANLSQSYASFAQQLSQPASGGGGASGGSSPVHAQSIQMQQTMAEAAQNLAQDNVNVMTTTDQVAQAQISAMQAASNLAIYTQTLAEDQNRVAEAQLGVVQATENVTQAQIQLTQASIQLANYANVVAEDQNKIAEAQLGVTQSSQNVAQAQIQLFQATQALDIASRTLAEDQNKVAEANTQLAQAQLSVFQAQIAVSQASKEQAISVQQAQEGLAQANIQVSQSTNQVADAQQALVKLNAAHYATQLAQANNQVADTQINLRQSTLSLQDAQWQLTYLEQEHASARDILVAQINLAQAQQQVTDTTTNLTAAQQQLQDLPTDHANQLADAQTALNNAYLQQQVAATAVQQKTLDLSAAQQNAANNSTIIAANLNLQQALQRVGDTSYQVITATQALQLFEQGTVQLAYAQAVTAVRSALLQQNDASYQVTQAQMQLNLEQDGSVQFNYQRALTQVQMATLQVNDANYQVTLAQQALNLVQDGEIQMQYKAALDNVTAASYAHAAALGRQAQDQNTFNFGVDNAVTDLKIMAEALLQSGNPALEAMGAQLLTDYNRIGNFGNQLQSNQGPLDNFTSSVNNLTSYLSDLATVAGSAAGMVQMVGQNLNVPGFTAPPLPNIPTNGPLVTGIPGYAAGGYITSPHLAIVGESGPEVILPLRDMAAAQQWLMAAGLIDSSGNPAGVSGLSGYGSSGIVRGGSQSVQNVTNNYNFNLANNGTGFMDPTAAMNEFFFQSAVRT